MQSLDYRTLPCPQPVVQCRKFLQENTALEFQIMVDNEPAVENVTRYLEQQGFGVSCTAQGSDFVLTAHKQGGETQASEASSQQRSASKTAQAVEEAESILVFITTETMGRGDEELGAKLMTSFLATLPEMGKSLWRVVLLNGGVKLASSSGAHLEHLQALEKAGVDVLVCGACLQHYGLLDQKAAGQTSNMLDIVTSLQLASKVIRP